MRSRVRLQYCKVIITTSLVWALFDVFLLMYLSDCTNPNQQCNNLIGRGGGAGKGGEGDGNDSHLAGKDNLQNAKEEEGFLHKILPRSLLPKRTPTGPGEMGKAVKVPENIQAEAKEKFKINQFNLIASDMISLNRSLPDVRMDSCKRKEYPSVNALPTTSVIIVFHNEAWSTLLRTVWSVINRSPRKLLEEIILVDDASEKAEVKQRLDDYVKTLPVPVHVFRAPKRAGLVRARLRGAAKAKGAVLTFLDAHCECTEGWLEPLLNEIYKDRTSVVCPIIDVISDDTFEYITGSDMTYGGFNWKLNFRWYGVPQRELQRRNGDRSVPLRSPTMAGGLFSIDRDYFYEIGSYDEGMDIWGGENLEMSFRVWMCGGQVLIVTCSRVGHVFRKTSPYSWPGGVATIINHNTMRIIEVWMDEYKEFYNKINPRAKSVNYGDISQRKELRHKLHCKSFRWYLENIYPESQIPIDYYSLGEVRNKATGMCLDSMGRKNNEKVGMVSCHGMGGNQVIVLTSKNRLMMDDNKCVGTRGSGYDLYMLACTSGNLDWNFDPQTSELKHISSNQCLGAPKPPLTDMPSIGSCSGALDQKWELEGYHS